MTAVRDVLGKVGIPPAWVTAETLPATSPRRPSGIFLHLVVRHWDATLLTHAFTLEKEVARRLSTLDARSPDWLSGIGWRFALSDESACPPLPGRRRWGEAPDQGAEHAVPAAGGAKTADKARRRAALDALMAAGDGQFEERPDFMPTQPLLPGS